MSGEDRRWLSAAIALAERGKGRTGNNPSVGCIIVKDGIVIGRGWTQAGGRPHAEAVALEQAGSKAVGATVYVSLEPCAHESSRGPACTDTLIAAKPARVVGALTDPDPRTAGKGFVRLEAVGIMVERDAMATEARAGLAGFVTRMTKGRPHVTLKLATSLDGCIAMADGSSRWITGEAARAHAHLERARSDAILVGAGTVRADAPRLDVRLSGLESRSPRRIMLGSGDAPEGWEVIRTPQDIASLDCNSLIVEGGAMTASAFLRAGLVDRLMLYRAPVLIGDGKPCLGNIGLADLAAAHGSWQLSDTRMLGNNRFEVYEAIPCSQA
ncbi:bifunctional diaminohydroxyphosphoribosylaminopyrimidine deaminase/5-amino-6-(5-phosphoribosylamino)uracil reductase RibD [uncultured Sphingorhabdus sp.]|uniref:bifunctional diaminohydroxyphosphoribosylaminopyrimidine deaminase/5-amino-6-(5-phosphoribosylamino)uracil reductase RibD n=1 Tax=uncultured Sphingorhabdus sp. TaxID=1686106 RepID=UPI002625D947|nr:bifunctional diaminohydroxyphosphoribosylaminopyrimidine deaminase/5-amino-6-(5-phosphoribosylamino)uracil reductase RibD [uncultured Sphingorhabdus sp.]HMS19680.1 bifunctional diaminohydroxyphosphoribosylaminopyrimidine deaminase/5-amino-6-(5-phosphoribosylamino)uracil reductase RibD [Sphingorhabdus sp.]